MTMMVDYLPDGYPNWPLIRFYGIEIPDFYSLKDICNKLHNNAGMTYKIDNNKAFCLHGLKNLLLISDNDSGATLNDHQGEWNLSPENWGLVALLVKALIDEPEIADKEFYQWASGERSQSPFPEHGLPVLISRTTTGLW